MPSKSKAQRNLMAAVANNPKFAKKAGIPQTVGADYMKADKVKKYKSGGKAAGGEVKTRQKRMGTPQPRNFFGMPSLKNKKTVAEALEELKAKQEGLATRNLIRDQFGSELDDPNFRVEINGKEATGLKSGGKIRGYGMARGGKVCKMR